MTLKLRDASHSPRAPFSFETEPTPPLDDAVGPHPRPPGDFLPERDMHMYGAQPLAGESSEPGRSVLRCGRCGRAVLEWAAAEHKRICSHVLDGAPLTVKKAAKDVKKDTGKKRRASEEESPDASPSKKRAKITLPDLGSDEELDLSAYKGMKKSEIKKLLKERERLKKRAAKEEEKLRAAERRRARLNNPLDYDRQCGVINDKGLPCSRSLTCKTHTVGAKRAVQGRTRLYDELFLEWQRAHNPNFKEPQPKAKDKLVIDRKKKRRPAQEEDGLRFDEDGAREMEELVRATRISGDRCAASFRPVAPRPEPAAPFPSVWRTTTYEQLSMGDLLTKALAARPRPQPAGMPQRMGSISKPGPGPLALPTLAPGVTA